MQRFFSYLAAIGSLFLLTSCAGYQIGPAKPAFLSKVKTLAVPIFKNKSLEPRIEALVTDTVIQQIQQDGTYQIASETDADAILEGSIESVVQRRARSVRGNVDATREFILNVELTFALTDRVTGVVLDRQTIVGTTSYFVGLDLQQQERQGVVLAAQDAAVRLTSRISEGW